MIHSLDDRITLRNGVTMPGLGLGVWRVPDGEPVIHSVLNGLEAGYRMIDTAERYHNERGVGEAIRRSGIARDQLFITSKLWNDDQGYESTLRAYDTSLKKLGLDYLDLYLIHWPITGVYQESWKAMVKLYQEGRVRAIGVSNFHPHHIESLKEVSDVVPFVDQVELHPLLSQEPLRQYCKQQGIQIEGYSPLGTGTVLDNPVIVKIASQYDKTPAQIILRWAIQNDIIVIPRSTQKAHIESNAAIFDFTLSASDIAAIDAINQNKRNNTDPDTV
ncbi:diketogulonate reductase-like aldo/keto reductase [Sporolactobacillus spathodeae]|uniref:Diketogulonate reductase-like aldo/keto reductase n=1 Tax=Sporolactobacillus spathodeae TaxID=1465502 RepID=A0ABS2Q7H2_9BACL|nr:aldo/keto reductase [Sporolactobacillus spathodeae]MBM7657727.1 diketogulonate reductase-like aldo/keto reductase [Sporolactobacillus spathodeae]